MAVLDATSSERLNLRAQENVQPAHYDADRERAAHFLNIFNQSKVRQRNYKQKATCIPLRPGPAILY